MADLLMSRHPAGLRTHAGRGDTGNLPGRGDGSPRPRPPAPPPRPCCRATSSVPNPWKRRPPRRTMDRAGTCTFRTPAAKPPSTPPPRGPRPQSPPIRQRQTGEHL